MQGKREAIMREGFSGSMIAVAGAAASAEESEITDGGEASQRYFRSSGADRVIARLQARR